MKTKNILAGVTVIAVLVTSTLFLSKIPKDGVLGKMAPQSLLASAGLGVQAGPTVGTNPNGDSTCGAKLAAAFSAVSQVSYTDPILNFIHTELARFNKFETADAEMALCHFVASMGMNPTLTSLPQTLTKTFGGHTVVLTVSKPTESFATTNAYTAKATVTFDGNQFMAIWWGGTDTSTKGYLIQGSMPFSKDGNARLKYLMWDRTGASQFVKVFTTQFTTSYLGSYTAASGSTTGGDHVHFGRATYNTSTKAITMQSINIRGTPAANPTGFGCFRAMASGTLGGTLSAYHTDPSLQDSVTSTYRDGTNMKGVTGITDATTTAAGSGTRISAPSTLPNSFDYACNDIDTAGSSSGVFASNTVSYSTAPSSVFPN